MYNSINNTEEHNPFYIRRSIVRASLAIAFLTFIVSGFSFTVLVAYLLSATVLDQFLFHMKKMKSSDYAQANRLLAENQATLEQLDQYSASRRKIRLTSLCIAAVAAGAGLFTIPSYFLAAFCVGFILTTLAGIAYLRPHINNKYPPFFVRDDRYYNPKSGPRPGFITPAQAALALNGSGPYGPIQP